MTAKTLCPGTGSEPVEVRVFIDGSLEGDKFAKCGECKRVLKPTKSNRLRQHQARGRTTVSMDKTMDILWSAARPTSGTECT